MKKVISVIVCLIMCISVVACSNKTTNEEVSSVFNNIEQVTEEGIVVSVDGNFSEDTELHAEVISKDENSVGMDIHLHDNSIENDSYDVNISNLPIDVNENTSVNIVDGENIENKEDVSISDSSVSYSHPEVTPVVISNSGDDNSSVIDEVINSSSTPSPESSNSNDSWSDWEYSEWSIKKQATCVENGKEVRTLSRTSSSGKTETRTEEREIIASGHKYVTKTVSPTANSQGYDEHKCSICNDYYRDNYKNRLNNNSSVSETFGNWVKDKETVVSPATCKQDGSVSVTYKRTSNLNNVEYKTEIVKTPKISHITEIRNKKDATYTSTGYTGDVYCRVCGDIISYGRDIPKLVNNNTSTPGNSSSSTPGNNNSSTPQPVHNHTYSSVWAKDSTYHWHNANCGHSLEKDRSAHTFNNGVITKEATTSSTGTKTYTCTVCGYTKTETIPKVSGGSSSSTPSHTHSYNSPSFSWNGYDKCTATFKCVDNDDTQTVSATVSNKVTKQPTETATGVKTYTATVTFKGKTYTDTKTETLAKLTTSAETWGNWEVTKEEVTKNPDCEHTGTKTITYKRTSNKNNTQTKTETVTIEALGHNYSKTTVAPTETKEGYDLFTCSRCGHNYKANKVPKLDTHTHSWKNVTPWHSEYGYYTEDGKAYFKCSCGETKTCQGTWHVIRPGQPEQTVKEDVYATLTYHWLKYWEGDPNYSDKRTEAYYEKYTENPDGTVNQAALDEFLAFEDKMFKEGRWITAGFSARSVYIETITKTIPAVEETGYWEGCD